MRPTLLAFLATASLASATAQWCLEANLEDLATGTACSCPKQLTKCLSAIRDTSLASIKACYVSNECDDFTATRHSQWIARECPQSIEEGLADLRKRQQNKDDEETESPPTTEETKPKATPAPVATTEGKKETAEEKEATEDKKETTEDKKETTAKDDKTTSPAKTEATVTKDQTTASPKTGPSATSTPESTTQNPTTTPSAQPQTTSTTKLECFVTNMVSTDVCSWTSGKSFNCVPTITPSPSCAPGIICQKDVDNSDICMIRDKPLTTSGLIVSIVFAVAIIGALTGILVMQMKAAKMNKRAKMERMAMLSGGKGYGKSDVEPPQLKTRGSDAHIPLIDSAEGMGVGNSGAGLGGGVGQYFDNRAYDISPQDAPKLNPGLGALGQDGYRDR